MTSQKLTRKKLWDFDGWGLWQWKIDEAAPIISREYTLFHACSIEQNHRGIRNEAEGDSVYCVRCLKTAPDGAVAVLELMNWKT